MQENCGEHDQISHAESTGTDKYNVVQEQPTKKESFLQQRLSRRKVNKSAAVTAGSLVISALLGGDLIRRHKNSEERQEVSPVATQEASQAMTEVAEQDPWQAQNEILRAEVFTDERVRLEHEYSQKAELLSEIDLGLTVCVNRQVREELMAKRWALREAGHDGMQKLSAEQIAFCQENQVATEVLGMCLDSYEESKAIIAQLQDRLRDDPLGKSVDPEMLMINPGGLAKLIMTETNGFTFIGGDKAVNQLFKDNKPDEVNIQNLETLCKNLSDDTGLKFNYENIAGSMRGNEDENHSGGAIGIQFMPDRAVEYYEKLKNVGEIGNIFDPIQSIKMAWTFLACHEWVGPKYDDFRWGYMKGDTKTDGAIELALRKWNDKDDQMIAIKNAAVKYSNDGL